MTKVFNPPAPTFGIKDRLIVPGRVTDGLAVASICALSNSIAYRRLRQLVSISSPLTGPIGYTTALTHGYFFTSSGCGKVAVRVAFGPTDSSSATPWVQFTVGGVAQPKIYAPSDNSGTKSIDSFDEVRWSDQIFVDGSGDNLSADTGYSWSMEMSGTACILFNVVVFELPLDGELDTDSASLALDPAALAVGAPITTTQMNAILDKTNTLYKRGGPPLCSWSWTTIDSSFGSASTEPAVTGTSWARVMDGGSATFATSAAGHQIWAYRRNSHVTSTFRCTAWAVLKTSSGGGAECRFETAAGVQATCTTSNTSYTLATANFSLTGANTRDLVVVSHRNTTGGQTTNTVAYGIIADDV